MRYEVRLYPWTGIFPAFPHLYPTLPREGLWFWANFPERRPYIRKRVKRLRRRLDNPAPA